MRLAGNCAPMQTGPGEWWTQWLLHSVRIKVSRRSLWLQGHCSREIAESDAKSSHTSMWGTDLYLCVLLLGNTETNEKHKGSFTLMTNPQACAILRGDNWKAKGTILALGFWGRAEEGDVCGRGAYMAMVAILTDILQTCQSSWGAFQGEKHPRVFSESVSCSNT